MAKVEIDPETGCWIWTSAVRADGYALFWFEGGCRSAGRWIYELKVGPIPEGFQLDHFVCENPGCVNPEHVRPTTPRENALRSNSPCAWKAAQTHCKHGHEFDEENTYWRPDGNGRECVTCRKAYWRQRYLDRRSA